MPGGGEVCRSVLSGPAWMQHECAFPMGTQWGAALISAWSWSWPRGLSAQIEPLGIQDKPKQLCLHLMSSSCWSRWRSVTGKLDWSPSTYVSSSWSPVSLCVHMDTHTHFRSLYDQASRPNPIQPWQALLPPLRHSHMWMGRNLDPQAAAFSRCLSLHMAPRPFRRWLACPDAHWQIRKDFFQLLTHL